MTKTEWMDRYAARIMFRAEWDKESAIAASMAGAQAFEEEERAAGNAIEWADPEGMADDEISCWTNDGED